MSYMKNYHAMKRYIKSLVSLLMVIVLLTTITPLSLAESEMPSDVSLRKEANYSLEKTIINNLNSLTTDIDRKIKVEAVKELTDFNGNRYYVVEFANAGYMIFHGDSGEIIEYSFSAPSPYSGCYEGLYYCGPQNYFELSNSKKAFRHTISNISLSSDSKEVLSLAELSEEANSVFMNQQKSKDSSYAIDETIPTNILESGEISLAASKSTSNFYISGGNKLANMATQSQIGYVEGGLCGYIGAGLLLYWFDEAAGCDNVINDFAFLNENHSGFRGGQFTKYLRRFGSSNLSDAVGLGGSTSIKDVIDGYFELHYINASVKPTLNLTNSDIEELLISKNSPVLVFGRISSEPNSESSNEAVNHGVLAYGYTLDGDIVVHYGWEKYSEVYLRSQFLGRYPTALFIETIADRQPTFTDITSSYWAYNAAKYCARYQIISTINGAFNGGTTANRGLFVNALYRLAGMPKIYNSTAVENQFTDFTSSSQYHDAAVWAVENDILRGSTATTLGLTGNLTREQAVVFLHRFSQYMKCEFNSESGPSASTFADYSNVGGFAVQAMDWATKHYVINGNGGYLYPKNTLTRAETAQMIYNLSNRATCGTEEKE